MRDLKSPAPIPDHGLFRAIFKARISMKCEGLFLFRHTPGGREIVSRKRKDNKSGRSPQLAGFVSHQIFFSAFFLDDNRSGVTGW